jgi:LmbE family N-acetylglucosaminyl deacetylase
MERASILAVIALVTGGLFPQGPPAGPSVERKLLAVFAHPDDETMAGPLLAHYARQNGTRVHLVVTSNGENGVMPFAGIPAGEQLAAVRVKEAACAAEALGSQPPILLAFPDGALNQSRVLAELGAKLEQTIRELGPDAIVTWGPEGGYGHPDHRLISAVVTQIVQGGGVTPHLFYAALPKSGLHPEMIANLRFPAPFRPTADEYLNVRVRYTSDDAARARAALGCHKSQFTTATMDQITALTEQINHGIAYLRSWAGGPVQTDLFAK